VGARRPSLAYRQSLIAMKQKAGLAALEAGLRAKVPRRDPAEADRLFSRLRASDAAAARELVIALPNAWRGRFVAWCFRSELSRPVLRVALHDAWCHDHDHVRRAARTRACLRRWFEKAAFELPASLPDPVTVWRGASGVSADIAARGESWTTNRSMAAFFACDYRPRGEPVVVKRTVQRREVLMASEERQESELVILSKGPFEVDGTPDEWRALVEPESGWSGDDAAGGAGLRVRGELE
jgi:hypothetical protein